MTTAAVIVLTIWVLALLDMAQEGKESWWSRISREAKRRAKELL